MFFFFLGGESPKEKTSLSFWLVLKGTFSTGCDFFSGHTRKGKSNHTPYGEVRFLNLRRESFIAPETSVDEVANPPLPLNFQLIKNMLYVHRSFSGESITTGHVFIQGTKV